MYPEQSNPFDLSAEPYLYLIPFSDWAKLITLIADTSRVLMFFFGTFPFSLTVLLSETPVLPEEIELREDEQLYKRNIDRDKIKRRYMVQI